MTIASLLDTCVTTSALVGMIEPIFRTEVYNFAAVVFLERNAGTA